MNGFSYAKTIRICNVYPGLILIPIGKEKEREEIYFMNKYSKRALKTTATVGMSLAMVLSAVTPAMAATAIGDPATCVTANTNAAKDLITMIKADLAADAGKYKLSTVPVDKAITWTTAKNLVGANLADSAMTLDAFLALASTVVKGAGTETVIDLIAGLSDCETNADAKFLAGHEDDETDFTGGRYTFAGAVEELTAALIELDAKFNEDGPYNGGNLNKTEYNSIKDEYAAISRLYSDYKGNLNSATASNLKGYYELYFTEMESAVEEYQESFIGDTVDGYVDALKVATVGDTTVGDLVDKDGKFNRADLSKLEDFIKDVKGNKIKTLSAVAKYSVVEDDSDVADYMDRLEEMVEEIKEVNTLMKSTNADLRNYKKVETKVNALAGAYETYVASDSDAHLDDYDDAFNAFRSADIENLKGYVENVLEGFYTVEAVKRSNGNYSLRLQEADFARYLATKTDVLKGNLETLITTNFEKAEEDSIYTNLVGGVSEAEKYLKQATTDIENLTLSSKLTDKEAAKIIAARKAYNALVGANGTGNFYNLTSKEVRAVRANGDLIEALYFKLILNGDVVEAATGWVDKGNGNWDFFDTNGKPVTKWVAAGKDWYFVKDGKMLRNAWVAQDATGAKWYYVDNAGKMVSNTTIDGFVIDANGIWTK